MAEPNKKYFPKLKGSLILGSVALMAFLGTWEGASEYKVYADKLANGLPTVCKGLTRHVTTTPIVVGEVWAPEKCEFEEQKAVIAMQLKLANCFNTLPPQSVFDAATSHAWNNGLGATCGSQAMAAWRLADWTQGCRRIAFAYSGKRTWSYVRSGTLPDGKPKYTFVQGLANRRDAEYKLCLTGVPK